MQYRNCTAVNVWLMFPSISSKLQFYLKKGKADSIPIILNQTKLEVLEMKCIFKTEICQLNHADIP